jgi:hypothetical protein
MDSHGRIRATRERGVGRAGEVERGHRRIVMGTRSGRWNYCNGGVLAAQYEEAIGIGGDLKSILGI